MARRAAQVPRASPALLARPVKAILLALLAKDDLYECSGALKIAACEGDPCYKEEDNNRMEHKP